MRRLTRVLAALVLVAFAAGCDQPDVALGSSDGQGDGGGTPARVEQPPEEKSFLQGPIITITKTEPVTTDCVSEGDLDPNGSVSSDDPPLCNPNPDTLGTIHVRGTREPAGGDTEIVATVAKDVPVSRRTTSGDIEAASFGDLAEGDEVSIWITGPVMESFPVQGSASYVLIEAN